MDFPGICQAAHPRVHSAVARCLLSVLLIESSSTHVFQGFFFFEARGVVCVARTRATVGWSSTGQQGRSEINFAEAKYVCEALV